MVGGCRDGVALGPKGSALSSQYRNLPDHDPQCIPGSLPNAFLRLRFKLCTAYPTQAEPTCYDGKASAVSAHRSMAPVAVKELKFITIIQKPYYIYIYIWSPPQDLPQDILFFNLDSFYATLVVM